MSSSLFFNPAATALGGMSTVQLQAALTAAQAAYVDMMTGAKGVTFSYAQGDGAKTVSYTPTSIAQLTAFIQLLQMQIGVVCRGRRPIRFNF